MQFFIAILALSFLIIVHEFGHFIVAKLSGIRVLEFSLFMGPKLFGIQKGETLYTLRLIPLGGYVKMEGEEQASEDERAFNKKPILTRAAVVAAGPIMNILVALILITILVSFVGYKTTNIGIVAPTSPAYEVGLKPGDKILSYGGYKVIHPFDISLFLYGTKGKPVDLEVQRGSKVEKIKISPEIFPKNRYLLGFTQKTGYGGGSNIVGDVKTDSNAYKAGLRINDEIIKLNDVSVSNNREIREFLNTNKGRAIKITVLRNGQEEKFNITPAASNQPEQYNIGIDFYNVHGNFVDTAKNSFIYAVTISRNVYYSLTWLITGKFSLSQMSGPVGIVSTIGDVVKLSPTLGDKILGLINITSLISINLGLFNLIPFPALDGSKLTLYCIEAVRRKAIPPEKEALISLVGLVLLVMLMIFTTYNDILRKIAGG